MDAEPMAICPKCESDNIGGPEYKETSGSLYNYTFVDEHLAYLCCRCGYQQRVKCADAKP